MSVVVYGIRNCDTLKKALKWLDNQNISYRFHDYRKDGLPPSLLDEFIEILGWEALLNRRGTTYRTLSDECKSTLDHTRLDPDAGTTSHHQTPTAGTRQPLSARF